MLQSKFTAGFLRVKSCKGMSWKSFAHLPSWIFFTLTEYRLRGFAPAGSFCSLTGFHCVTPVRKSAAIHIAKASVHFGSC